MTSIIGARAKLALQNLLQLSGTFVGVGLNHENKPFDGAFTCKEIFQKQGLNIFFDARSSQNSLDLFHNEISTIALNCRGGLSLFNLNSNTPFLCEHDLVDWVEKPKHGVFVFRYGLNDDIQNFREVITLTIKNVNEVEYAYSWGMPNGAFAERSKIKLIKVRQVDELDLRNTILNKNTERSATHL